MFKTKSEFQKKLMSEGNLNKYRQVCISLMKSDEEIKKSCETLNIVQSSFEDFLESNLFSDKIFLYKLENFLSSDTNKQKKEKFYKDEIKKIVEGKLLDAQYESKVRSFTINIEKHISNIQNYEFFI